MEEPYWEVNDDEYEVIDMEAEEKLCNELITKEQAFQVIADNNSSTKMTLACYDALLDGIAKAKAIEAEPIRQWIPVSERLPKDRDWYLAIFKEAGTGWVNPLPFVSDYLGRRTKATTNEGWIIHNCTDGDVVCEYYRNLECVAWMPLPEPYKGE